MTANASRHDGLPPFMSLLPDPVRGIERSRRLRGWLRQSGPPFPGRELDLGDRDRSVDREPARRSERRVRPSPWCEARCDVRGAPTGLSPKYEYRARDERIAMLRRHLLTSSGSGMVRKSERRTLTFGGCIRVGEGVVPRSCARCAAAAAARRRASASSNGAL